MTGTTLLAIVESLRRPQGLQANPYLIGLLGLILMHALGELFIATGAYRYAPHLAGIQLPIRMLLGPALYLYALSMMSSQKPKVGLTCALAMLGPIIIAIIMLPFASLSAEDKLALANPATRDPALFRLAWITCSAATATFIAFTGIYWVMTFRLQKQHRHRTMARFANIEKRALDWLRYSLYVWGFLWLFFGLDLVFWINNLHVDSLSAGLALVQAFALIAFAHLAINQPQFNTPQPKKPPTEKSNRQPVLTQSHMERIATKLKQTMQNEQLFSQNDLSLRQLADATGISENHLSETFSQYLKTNFFNFINAYRVDHAQHLLTTTDHSITTIAFEVGFNSRSTFNSAFKKATQLTPTALRQQAVSAKASE